MAIRFCITLKQKLFFITRCYSGEVFFIFWLFLFCLRLSPRKNIFPATFCETCCGAEQGVMNNLLSLGVELDFLDFFSDKAFAEDLYLVRVVN